MLHLGRLTILASFCAFTGMVMTPRVNAIAEAEIDQSAKQTFISQIPMDKLPDQVRTKLTYVIGRAQLFEKGKSEAFPCNPEVYRWLLESPDASLFAWKKLGATKASVTRLENGSFLGTDGNGGEMRWTLIATGPTTRIWYAEGSGRIGPLLPTMTIRAIVALHFEDVKGTDGRKGVKHRLELLAHYDSSMIVNKLTNMSADSTGKKVMQQLEVFFSGMAWYVSEHSAWSRLTFSTWATTPETKNRAQQLISKLDQADAAIENVIPTSK